MKRRLLRFAHLPAQGFTLIELVIIIAILAIMASIAAPSFTAMLATMNVRSAGFDLVSDLTMARSEAVKRNRSISVLPVSEDWVNGWVIDDNGTALMSRNALPASLTILAPEEGITFLPSGRVSGMAASGSWALQSSTPGATARCVVITPTGSARAKPGEC